MPLIRTIATLLLAGCFPNFTLAADAPAELPRFLSSVPHAANDCTAERQVMLEEAAPKLVDWAAARAWSDEQHDPQEVLNSIRSVVLLKQQVDASLETVLSLRTRFAEQKLEEEDRKPLHHWLGISSGLIDLSGRLRYILYDAVNNATYALAGHDEKLAAMIDLLIEHKVEVGANIMPYVLFDPLEGEEKPFSAAIKLRVLKLIEVTGQTEQIADLAEYLQEPNTPPELALRTVEVIWNLGVPQHAEPNGDPELPQPAITAGGLYQLLENIPAEKLFPPQQALRETLLAQLKEREEKGVTGESYKVGRFSVQPGDWFLMRNPSPYNQFTDISPGLFTHVGIVAAVVGEDGRRRFVITEVPERGDRIPATNVDAYLKLTLHYVFLRHHDEKVNQTMGEAAAELIGNESVFDLVFRTDRVTAAKGTPLADRKVHTYCAGYLLMVAQETSAPRSDFFPVPEYPAPKNCLENLEKIGLSMGKDFVSPTGAIFSTAMEIVGRREPMYEPGREIKEAVYDHFAQSMTDKVIQPSPDRKQELVQKLADLSKYNPWLAKALASANNVNEQMDLSAAAKASAVIQTLDEIAEKAAEEYYASRDALTAGPTSELIGKFPPDELKEVILLRRLHEDLLRQYEEEEITPRQLRIALVDYYINSGKENLDARFFPE